MTPKKDAPTPSPKKETETTTQDTPAVFIEMDYTGRVDGAVFDTTRAADAPPNTKQTLKPAVIKLGSGQLIPGLDAFLIDKKPGEYTLTLEPEQAFGKKQSQLLKLVPLTAFGKDAKRLEVGMSVTIGEQSGRVKSVSGGRVVVDFNHPLAGLPVEYSVTIHGVVTDEVKKVQSTVRGLLGVELPVERKEGAIVLKLPQGFPAEPLLKEIERHSGVAVKHEEVALKANQHTHADGTVHDNSAHKH
jgi:FKBP-type peptidyl-prolyl cis-trans isomerase 2